jgi:hypothetical protein
LMTEEEFVHYEEIDSFAVHFLRMVEDELFVSRNIKIGWMPEKIIAVFCSDHFWNGPVQDIMSHARFRYGTPMRISEANGCWLGVLRNDQGKIEGFPKQELSRIRLELGFPRELVELAAPYDVMIFLHKSNLEKTRRFWEQGEEPVEVLPTHFVVAHECVHIIETLLDQSLLEKHDPGVYFEVPEVTELVRRFCSSMPSGEFKRRYFHSEECCVSPGPSPSTTSTRQ